MTGALRKIIAGGGGRKTRFHDEAGQFMGFSEFRHLPNSFLMKLRTKFGGERPDIPWWPYSAVAGIAAILDPSSQVIEFGSGSSTVWLGKRAGRVVAIEDDLKWCQRIQNRIAELGYDGLTVKHRQGEAYYDVSDYDDATFDLAIIDGYCRFRCFEFVLPKLKPGGYVYLDNSDADKDANFNGPGEQRKVQDMMLSYHRSHADSDLIAYCGLFVGEVHAGQGLLLRLSRDHR